MNKYRLSLLALLALSLGGGAFYLQEQNSSSSASKPERIPGAAAVQDKTLDPLDRGQNEALPEGVLNTEAQEFPFIMAYVDRPEYADKAEETLPLGASNVRYVKLDSALLDGKQSPLWKLRGEGAFTLSLPDGKTVKVLVQQSTMLDSKSFSMLGVIEGQKESRVIFTGGAEGQYAMAVTTVEAGSDSLAPLVSKRYVMAPVGAAEMQFFEIDPSQAPGCGGQLQLPVSAQVPRPIALAASVPSAPSLKDDSWIAAAAAPLSPQVDVLFVYNQAVYNSLLGTASNRLAAINTRVSTIVTEVNDNFTRSLINLRIRSAGIETVDFNEFTPASADLNDTALASLAIPDDGVIDNVQALRELHGADLVCLMLSRHDSSSIGVAYLLDSPTVNSTMGSVLNDSYAFSVVTWGYTIGYDLVSHELGHNFGAQHDRENALNGLGELNPGAFSYGYGYRFYAQGTQYHTIMSYDPGTSISYFSNPNVTWSGVSLGVAEGLAGQSYNAKVLDETGFEVSQYRMQVQDPIAAGTMVNVSTRAFVGVDTQQLTAGFAIDGTGTKQVLIRATGPSLAPFGVLDWVSDPWIELTAVPSLIVKATADNWLDEANAASISAVTTQMNAFALTDNRDSAILINLEPGMYTAKVEGVGGATGIGLVEVYETPTHGTAKLVNVSTRAYASTIKPMVGGFIISGEAGTTKRVLIRAQGPNLLTTYSVPGVMSDPMLKLFKAGADNRLLVANDDWTSSVGQVDDEHSVPYFADELAIAATGFAPKNRREPCVLLDLEPGMYTVEVTPFSDSSSSQDEKPGVALVEVFEIK